MRDEFMIERGGKQFVLFAGLLDEAHSKHGLKGIHTELLDRPWENKQNCAVVKATVETESGVFTGIGDASPSNVGKNIVEHIIRMAETRAKARALRDAVNVGTTALEELGDGESGSVPAASSESAPDVSKYRGQAQRAKNTKDSRGGSGGDAGEQPATKKQLNFLEALINDSADWDSVEEWEQSHQLLETLTRADASAAIGALSG